MTGGNCWSYLLIKSSSVSPKNCRWDLLDCVSSLNDVGCRGDFKSTSFGRRRWKKRRRLLRCSLEEKSRFRSSKSCEVIGIWLRLALEWCRLDMAELLSGPSSGLIVNWTLAGESFFLITYGCSWPKWWKRIRLYWDVRRVIDRHCEVQLNSTIDRTIFVLLLSLSLSPVRAFARSSSFLPSSSPPLLRSSPPPACSRRRCFRCRSETFSKLLDRCVTFRSKAKRLAAGYRSVLVKRSLPPLIITVGAQAREEKKSRRDEFAWKMSFRTFCLLTYVS